MVVKVHMEKGVVVSVIRENCLGMETSSSGGG